MGNKISRGAITDGGFGERFKRTIIDNISQCPPVHFVYRICGGCWVRARGVFWGHAEIADSGGMNDTIKCHNSLRGSSRQTKYLGYYRGRRYFIVRVGTKDRQIVA